MNFIDLFGFPKKITDLYFIFNEFSAKFLSLKLDAKDILYFLNALDAFIQYDAADLEAPQKVYDYISEKYNKLDIFTNLFMYYFFTCC